MTKLEELALTYKKAYLAQLEFNEKHNFRPFGTLQIFREYHRLDRQWKDASQNLLNYCRETPEIELVNQEAS